MQNTKSSRLSARINNLVMVVLIIICAGLLAWLSNKYTFQSDWTRNGSHTLSNASLEVISRLKQPVEITAYARENSGLRENIETMIGRYQKAEPEKFKLKFINPDVVPEEVRSLGITVNGELVLRYQQRSQHVQDINEEEITNALQRLLRGGEKWIAFSDGHGERNPLGEANFDLSIWARQLSNRGFKIQPLNLADVQSIPENTRVLVIAGPGTDFLPGEVEQIINFIDQGGNLLWLLDPPGNLSKLDVLAKNLGIKIESGTVIDVAGRILGLNDPTIALSTARLYPPHPVTTDFDLTTLFPAATAVDTSDAKKFTALPLIQTGDHAWLENGPLEGDVDFDPDTDSAGPVTIGVSLERTMDAETPGVRNIQQRIIVMGDGDFLSNTYVSNAGNLELGIRMMNWLGGDDDLITIPALQVEDGQLELNTWKSAVIAFGFFIFLPLLLFGTGLFLWWHRKKR